MGSGDSCEARLRGVTSPVGCGVARRRAARWALIPTGDDNDPPGIAGLGPSCAARLRVTAPAGPGRRAKHAARRRAKHASRDALAFL